MGSVRLRVVSGQAAAVPGVRVPPCEFLVGAVTTLGALAWEFAPRKCWGARPSVGRGHCRPIVTLDFTVLAEPGGCGWVARWAACYTETLDNVPYNTFLVRAHGGLRVLISALSGLRCSPRLDD